MIPGRARDSFLLRSARTSYGAPGGGSRGFAGVKQPVRDADHLPSSDGQVENEWSYTSSLSASWHTRRQLCFYIYI